MKPLYILLAVLPLLAACTTITINNVNEILGPECASRRYILQRVNGQPFSSAERRPDIEISEQMRVSGRICNSFSGHGRLDNGVLTVPGMGMTLMSCADPALNQLENDFTAMIRQGARVSRKDNTLTLEGNSTSLEYLLAETRTRGPR